MTDFTLETAGPVDAEELTGVEEAAMVESLPHIFPPAEYPFPREAILERWQTELADPRFECLVHRRDGKIVGYIMGHGDWLNHIATLPSEWGSGLATVLMEAGTAARRAEGQQTLRLWVLRENHRARRLYEKLGWKPSGVEVAEPFPPHPDKLEYVLEG